MPMRGTLTFPGDKSLSHRAAIFATLARGTSTISNFLDAGDTMNTLKAMQALGAKVTDLGDRSFRVESPGLEGLKSPNTVIDCGNSGTGARLIMGLIAGLDGVSAVIDGDASLRKRPMRRVLGPLEKLGAKFEWLSDTDCLPVRIHGTKIKDVEFTETLGSAQVKSAVMLAAIASRAALTLHEPIPSRDHTENMLRFAGVDVQKTKEVDGSTGLPTGFRISLAAGAVVEPRDYKIWGDVSSAAFFAVGASLLPDSELLLRGILLNPYRDRYLAALKDMGAFIEILPQRDECGEKGGDVLVRPAKLKGIELAKESIPSLIDEIPVLTIAGVFAEGKFSYHDAKELRVKESDRIGIMAQNLARVGVAVKEYDDGMELEGNPQRALAGKIEPHMDHRIVMSFEIANLVSGGKLEIEGKEWVETSFPSFYEKLKSVVSTPLNDLSRRSLSGAEGQRGTSPQVITIDGPAGSGKSTVAYMLARALGYSQIDSGALYRAFTYTGYQEYQRLAIKEDWASAVTNNAALNAKMSEIHLELKFSDDGKQHVFVNGQELTHELRSPEIVPLIKPVADARYLRERVREVLAHASTNYSLVADGRDMGTEVFTHARFKFFLTANSRTRAERRLAEFREKSPSITLDEVERQIVDRDRDDMNREYGGLRPAPEAIFIDTSSHTQEQVADIMLAYIRNSRM